MGQAEGIAALAFTIKHSPACFLLPVFRVSDFSFRVVALSDIRAITTTSVQVSSPNEKKTDLVGW